MRIRFFSFVRALGVLLVVIYHFFPGVLPGGFIGVDIFFVFSGYLITGLALNEFSRTGRFSLKKFGRRRFFRIVPTVVFTLLVTLPLSLLVTSDLRVNIYQQAASAVSFTTNFFEQLSGLSYDQSFNPHLFVHFWSLAIEVQFYIVWGIIIWLLAKAFRARHNGMRIGTFVASVLLFGASTIGMGILSFKYSGDFSHIYYSSLWHVFPFFLGAALSCFLGITKTRAIEQLSRWKHPWINTFFALIAGGGLVTLGFTLDFSNRSTFTYGLLIAALLAGFLIVNLRLLHEKSARQEPRIITWLSDTSYGIYVFHWPLILIAERLWPSNYALAVIVATVLTLGLSSLMYYGIDPVISGKRKLRHIGSSIAFVGVGLVLTFAAGWVIGTAPTVSSIDSGLFATSMDQTQTALGQAWKILNPPPKPKPVGPPPFPKPDDSVNTPYESLLIGDSVAQGGTPQLQADASSILIDAAAGRRWPAAADLIAPYSSKGALPQNLIVALGMNQHNNQAELDSYETDILAIVQTYAPAHNVIFVTPSTVNSQYAWEDGLNEESAYMRGLATRYKNVYIADWNAISANHPELFDPADGSHIFHTPAGQVAWAEVISRAITQADKNSWTPTTSVVR